MEIIKSESNIETFIISDECIGEYYHYLGELNTFLVFAIGNIVSDSLKDKLIVKIMSITIRNQIDIIKSAIGSTTFSRRVPSDKVIKDMST